MKRYYEYTKEEKKKEKEATEESGGTIRTSTCSTASTEAVGVDSTECQKEIF